MLPMDAFLSRYFNKPTLFLRCIQLALLLLFMRIGWNKRIRYRATPATRCRKLKETQKHNAIEKLYFWHATQHNNHHTERLCC